MNDQGLPGFVLSENVTTSGSGALVVDEWNIGTLFKSGIWAFYISSNYLGVVFCIILIWSAYKNPRKTAFDAFVAGLCSACLWMSLTCGSQCLLSVIHHRFYGGKLACEFEAFFHVSAILSQFGFVARIARYSYRLVIDGKLAEISVREALWQSVAIWAFCIVGTAVMGYFSPPYLMSAGTYCFYGFSSPAIAGWLVVGLVVALCIMTHSYIRIYQTTKSITQTLNTILHPPISTQTPLVKQQTLFIPPPIPNGFIKTDSPTTHNDSPTIVATTPSAGATTPSAGAITINSNIPLNSARRTTTTRLPPLKQVATGLPPPPLGAPPPSPATSEASFHDPTSTKSPSEPSTKSPSEPGRKSPKEPSTKSPKEPSTKSPKEPFTKSPNEPSAKSPSEPSDKSPSKPGPGPRSPADKFSAKPVESASSAGPVESPSSAGPVESSSSAGPVESSSSAPAPSTCLPQPIGKIQDNNNAVDDININVKSATDESSEPDLEPEAESVPTTMAKRSSLFTLILLVGWIFAAITTVVEFVTGTSDEWLVTTVGVAGVLHSVAVPVTRAYTSEWHRETANHIIWRITFHRYGHASETILTGIYRIKSNIVNRSAIATTELQSSSNRRTTTNPKQTSKNSMNPR